MIKTNHGSAALSIWLSTVEDKALLVGKDTEMDWDLVVEDDDRTAA